MSLIENLLKIIIKEEPTVYRQEGRAVVSKGTALLKRFNDDSDDIIKLKGVETINPVYTIDDYYTTEQAVKRTKITKSKLYKLCKDKEIEALKLGGMWFILKESLREYIRQQKKS